MTERTTKEILEELFQNEFEEDETKTDFEKLVLVVECLKERLEKQEDHTHTLS